TSVVLARAWCQLDRLRGRNPRTGVHFRRSFFTALGTRVRLPSRGKHGPGMSPLCLTFASCKYDRMEALRSGDVTADGIDLDMRVFEAGREIFDRMVGGREFDVAELSSSEFISLMGRGDCPFVALPVFPSRVFRHGYIFVNTRAGICEP